MKMNSKNVKKKNLENMNKNTKKNNKKNIEIQKKIGKEGSKNFKIYKMQLEGSSKIL